MHTCTLARGSSLRQAELRCRRLPTRCQAGPGTSRAGATADGQVVSASPRWPPRLGVGREAHLSSACLRGANLRCNASAVSRRAPRARLFSEECPHPGEVEGEIHRTEYFTTCLLPSGYDDASGVVLSVGSFATSHAVMPPSTHTARGHASASQSSATSDFGPREHTSTTSCSGEGSATRPSTWSGFGFG